MKKTVLITGANRGICLEWVKHYLGKDWNIIAAVRNPAQTLELQRLALEYKSLEVVKLDIGDIESIIQLAKTYEGISIDHLINNAGSYGTPKEALENNPKGTKLDALFRILAVSGY